MTWTEISSPTFSAAAAPASLGGVGLTTGLFPALTLGCGAVGGSSSSNNIGPLDLINLRRVAWGTSEEVSDPEPDKALVESLTQEILRRLNNENFRR